MKFTNFHSLATDSKRGWKMSQPSPGSQGIAENSKNPISNAGGTHTAIGTYIFYKRRHLPTEI